MFTEDFDELMSKIRDRYELMCNQCAQLRKQLDEFNKDEEIQKANKYANDVREHSLFTMSDKEMDARNKFVRKHYKTCSCGKAAITFEYGLTDTGIGETIYIRCTACGEREDITDFSNW